MGDTFLPSPPCLACKDTLSFTHPSLWLQNIVLS